MPFLQTYMHGVTGDGMFSENCIVPIIQSAKRTMYDYHVKNPRTSLRTSIDTSKPY